MRVDDLVARHATIPVRTSPYAIRADPRRVLARLLVAGDEMMVGGESRAALVVKRVLALSEPAAAAALDEVTEAFSSRHRDLHGLFDQHFLVVAHRLPKDVELSSTRRRLIGAYFTQEYAVEAAALFNPSIVLHPDQDGLNPGQARFVMSLRAVGEGHRSSIEFRTGVMGAGGTIALDDPGPYVVAGTPVDPVFDRALFQRALDELTAHSEDMAFVIETLPRSFGRVELDQVLALLRSHQVTRPSALLTSAHIELVASCNYDIEFPLNSALAERVLWPQSPTETNGMEDARFVKFIDDDGTTRYYGTYTAFDGSHIAPQLIETRDFRVFRVSQLTGPSAKNKGMALFPRRIDGSFVALTRSDRESIGIATSDNALVWGESTIVQSPLEPWELIQIGNCGSPIETPEGWLVLTHGVGPMRVYSMGAVLLDLHDPCRVIGRLRRPWLAPTGAERDGYVPNVVYSCGALVHDDTLVVPYGSSDAAVGIAYVALPELLAALRSP